MSPSERSDPAGRPWQSQDPVIGSSKPRLFGILGPGLITGASDDDPSGIATYSQAGAQPGFAALWLVQSCILLLVVANVINLGADLGAMGDTAARVFGGPETLYVLLFGTIRVSRQILLQYTRYVAVLKWITLVLLAYFGTLAMVDVPWAAAARGLVVPTVSFDKDFLSTLAAVLGTMISPYLFFWQASQEAEDQRVKPHREPLVDAPGQAPVALRRIRLDTYIGMAFSNLVALAILITAAATLPAHGVTDVQTSQQAAEALRPIAGRFAYLVFSLGIVGTGLLAVPVLAGSAAYAIGEARNWPVGFARKPMQAKAFYCTLAIATLIGVIVNFLPVDPIQALYWSAVINGVLAAPIMAVMMLLASSRRVMGRFTLPPVLSLVGWIATVVMALAVVGLLATALMQ